MPKRELAQRQVTLTVEAAFAQTSEMLRRIVFRPIDDAQVFPAAHLYRRLQQAAAIARDEAARLDDHPFAAIAGQVLPPVDSVRARGRIVQSNRTPARRDNDLADACCEPLGDRNVPVMFAIEPQPGFAGEQMKGCEPQVLDAGDR